MKLKALLQKHFALQAAIAAALNLPKEQMVGDEKFQTAVIDAKRLPDAHAEILAAFDEDEKTITANALAEAVKAGTHVLKDVHDVAITAAKDAGADEALKKFQTQAEATKFASGKRDELAKIITAEAAALVPDADLAAETHDLTFKRLTARAEALKKHGITPESRPKAFIIVASLKDDATYEASIGAVIEAAAGKVTTTASQTKVQPTTTAPAAPADGEVEFL